MALMISSSDFLEVEHTETHAEVSFGALMITADLGALVDLVMMFISIP
jgi:hypothetical protein